MQWDLSRLYAGFDDQKFADDFDRSEGAVKDILAVFHNADGSDAIQVLCDVIGKVQSFEMDFIRVSNFIYLTLSVDAENADALKQFDRMQRVSMVFEQAMSAWARYVGQIDDLPGIIAGNPMLLEHDDLLARLQEQAKHTIDPALEETVLTMQLSGGRAWEKLSELLQSTHMVKCFLDEEEQTLTLSQVRNMAYDPSPDVRRSAYESEIAGYASIEKPMAACLSGIKGEALTLAPLKHFDDVLDESLMASRMGKDVLDVMIAAMEESLPVFRRYLKAKARALGQTGGLNFYDLFAPLGENSKRYTLDEAKDLLCEALGAFSPNMHALIERAFDEHWIDALPREGKQGGAFCASAYPVGISYVLSNFDGSLNAVSTLAHELGHAYHNEQLYKNPILLSDAPMTLAETASIFNETLLTQTLIDRTDERGKLALLDQELIEATQTIVDILSRFYFERSVFSARKDQALTEHDFKAQMLDAQKKTYGDGLNPDCMHPYMWACKGHYYSADLHYYNFPYAFGLLFGKGIFEAFKGMGSDAVEVYEQLLQETGKCDAVTAAKSVGIDIEDIGFWRRSLAAVEVAVGQFEALIK